MYRKELGGKKAQRKWVLRQELTRQKGLLAQGQWESVNYTGKCNTFL